MLPAEPNPRFFTVSWHEYSFCNKMCSFHPIKNMMPSLKIVFVYLIYTSVYVCAHELGAHRGQRGHWIPWSWTFGGWLWAVGSGTKTAGAFNFWSIYPVTLTVCMNQFFPSPVWIQGIELRWSGGLQSAPPYPLNHPVSPHLTFGTFWAVES